MSIFSLTTTLVTIYLAVMRCLCVIRPLTFRGVLSPGKTTLIFLAFLAFALAIRLPLLALTDIRVSFNPRINLSRPAIWIHPARELVKDVTQTGLDIPLNITAEITLTICVIVMTRALKESSKFRSKLATSMPNNNGHPENERSRRRSSTTPNQKKSKTSDGANDDTQSGKLSKKDARVIKQLVFISLLFLCCNIPKLTRIVGDAAESEFSIFGRYRFLYSIVFTLQVVFEILNSSLNFFIYYKFNNKFRNSFDTFCVQQV
ncbi:hypothetical protein RRG08_047500 [Elysia crispata]|uniref:G-protein coupled receptors family 1 profile domain-containing protein n=1 Tax=Elysia crispata TaxID=231223 RepID=A0AAE0XXI7_9GAST|nr:hypothetical protein RRG08_047500 [Elysia crispata]